LVSLDDFRSFAGQLVIWQVKIGWLFVTQDRLHCEQFDELYKKEVNANGQ
jgi:hypothetical protein